MSTTASRPTYAWWIILCLVGLDYFSSLAYLPSIAITLFDGEVRDLAPLAGAGVVLITLLAALPVYWYVVGRSPHGKGGVGLLEQRAHGWGGKFLVLVMLGFIATDFVLTRTLSVSDAATHLLKNPYYTDLVPKRETVERILPGEWGSAVAGFVSEQLLVTLLLSVLAFGLYHFLVQSLSRGFVSFAVGIVLVYLAVNLIVIGSCLQYLGEHPTLVAEWKQRLLDHVGEERLEGRGAIGMLLLLGLPMFPAMAIGLSGFELTMAAAPSVTGSPSDDPVHPRGRIWRTRFLMLVAALVMSMLVLGATFVVALLVEPSQLVGATGVEHRALSYLAHGGMMADNALAATANSMFGQNFGSLYDLSTILILCLAGAGATISMREIVPDFLARFGMQLSWAHRIGVITHLFNGVILVVTIAFRASVTAQLWAYATAVIALLFGASFAALLDLPAPLARRFVGFLVRLPILLITLLFAAMLLLIVYQEPSGLAIALAFVLVVLVTAIGSRWRRSTEMRFEGFVYADEETRTRWEEMTKLEFQILVPHDPTHTTIRAKEAEVRQRHRIGQDVPIIFIEVEVGDPSDFFQKPRMHLDREEGREILRISRATSVAHVLAAIGLAFREVGHPPEFYFKWSMQSPMEATLNFLLLGQGNIPFLVRALLHHAEVDPARRPRVIVADA